MPGNEEKLDALLKDLHELTTYLHGRGDKTLTLSKKFEENARNDASNRDFDLNQARMLDYQHHIWHEIGIQSRSILPIISNIKGYIFQSCIIKQVRENI